MGKINVRNRNKKNPTRKPNWEYRFEVAKSKDKRQTISKSGFRTKKEALEQGAKTFTEYSNAGEIFTPSKISLSDFLDFWLDKEGRFKLKASTISVYCGMIERFIKPNIGKYKLCSIKPLTVSNLLNDLKVQGVTTSQIIMTFNVLKSAFSYAVFPMQYLQNNPMLHLPCPKANYEKKQRQALSYDTFKRILQICPKGDKNYIPLLFGWYCGLRISEMLALTWDDIDFEKKVLYINKQINIRYADEEGKTTLNYLKNGKTERVFTPPKYDSKRVINMNDALIKELKEHKEVQKQNENIYEEYYTTYYLKEGFNEKNEKIPIVTPCYLKDFPKNEKKIEFVCIKENGVLPTKKALADVNRQIKKKLGINFDYHTLRHTNATNLISNGADMKIVQDRLGHKNVMTTLNIYTKITQNMRDVAVKILDESVFDSEILQI